MDLNLIKDLKGLYQPTLPWDFDNPPMDIVDLAKSMAEIMIKEKGVGLAANQCGLPYSIFCMNSVPEVYVCINPKIVSVSEIMNELEEGCLSYPGLIIKRKMPRDCRIRFHGPDGETYTKQFTGMSARCCFHEMNHLTGELFWSNISKLKFDMAVKKASKRGFDYSNLTYKGL